MGFAVEIFVKLPGLRGEVGVAGQCRANKDPGEQVEDAVLVEMVAFVALALGVGEQREVLRVQLRVLCFLREDVPEVCFARS